MSRLRHVSQQHLVMRNTCTVRRSCSCFCCLQKVQVLQSIRSNAAVICSHIHTLEASAVRHASASRRNQDTMLSHQACSSCSSPLSSLHTRIAWSWQHGQLESLFLHLLRALVTCPCLVAGCISRSQATPCLLSAVLFKQGRAAV